MKFLLKHKFLVYGGVMLGLILLSYSVGHGAVINPNIPGDADAGTTEDPNPAGLVANLYQFALIIGGLLAFVAIVYGAIRYTAGAGNPSTQNDAKDRIQQALIGLALLIGAGLVLSTISPKFDLSGGIFTIPGLRTLPGPREERALFNVGFGNDAGNGAIPRGGRACVGKNDGDSCNPCAAGAGAGVGKCRSGICTNCQ